MVVVLFGLHSGLRLRLARTLSDREKQTCYIQVSALVIHGRLQNDRADAYGPNER